MIPNITDSKRITAHPALIGRSAPNVLRKVLFREIKNFVQHHQGMYLEFGVRDGFTVNFISQMFPDNTIYGFDSWLGLPEPWVTPWRVYPKGEFSTDGKLPAVRPNVKLISGWFEDSLPTFAEANKGKITAFVHIDCDLYSSTKTIFKNLGHTFVPGTIIVFDEYFRDVGEKQAFDEWLEETNLYASMIRMSTDILPAAFIITDGINKYLDAKSSWNIDQF